MLITKDLTYQYRQTAVLKNVAFELPLGTLGVLVGYNGAGKSTLLRCLAKWLHIPKGEISINGVSHQADRAYRQQLRFVPDTPDFYTELTAWEHLQFTAQLQGVADWEEEAEDLLETFNLDHAADNYPFTFSRGMRYKLALCMALIAPASLLLLDEPFGPLDPEAAADLWDLLHDYAANGRAVLLSAHALPTGASPDWYFHLQDGEMDISSGGAIESLGQLLNRSAMLPEQEDDEDAT